MKIVKIILAGLLAWVVLVILYPKNNNNPKFEKRDVGHFYKNNTTNSAKLVNVTEKKDVLDKIEDSQEFKKMMEKYSAKFLFKDRYSSYYLSATHYAIPKNFWKSGVDNGRLTSRDPLGNKWNLVEKKDLDLKKINGDPYPVLLSQSLGGPILPMKTLKIFLSNANSTQIKFVQSFIEDHKEEIDSFHYLKEVKTYYLHTHKSLAMLKLYQNCLEIEDVEKIRCAPEFYQELSLN